MSIPHSQVPLLDWTLADSDKPAFIAQLRGILINGGFLYLQNTPVPPALIDQMVDATAKFFALPAEAKDAADMNDTAHFNGYLRRGPVENPTREQFNYGDDHADAAEGAPVYHNIHGRTPWPDDALFPGCRAIMGEYYKHLKALSIKFTCFVAEALGLAADAFEPLFESDVARRQLRCKLLRYPACAPSTTGFVAHTDSNFLTYLLQASDEPGLEMQNASGEWSAAPTIRGTFIILVGRVLEKITHRLVKAPMHRVVSPTKGTRYSVGYFQGVAMDTRVAEASAKYKYPQEVLDMQRAREEREGDNTEFRLVESDNLPAGEAVLNFKLKAHPLVAYKFYPALFPKFYPDGLPAKYASMVH
ncbi:Fe2OG dioxygenase domain-containing protein [Mycena sanguinolenta]|uniref:Fe2OG dioxygenase domain-containing protein n=1 Tax=Mycena sanguinolenta TaxID=230812 RepID=A0A8H6XKK7_9AGAR|nr:Fe2OG dioxygenase domain-containing protein [Mycena sanguinolenta]